MDVFGFIAFPFAGMGFIFGVMAFLQCAELKKRLDAIEADRGKPPQ